MKKAKIKVQVVLNKSIILLGDIMHVNVNLNKR